MGSPKFQWRELAAPAPGTEAHYYLRVRMADNQNIWTGPVYVTYEASSPVAVEGPPAPRGRLTLAAHPNPTQGSLTAEFDLQRDEARVSLAIYDLSGRQRRSLLSGALAGGPHRVTWDGRSDEGGRLSAGIFFLRLETGAARVERKVLLLR